jgi:IS5 family transposase
LIRCNSDSDRRKIMARRRIGQEQLRIITNDAAAAGALDQIAALIDWSEIDRQLVGIYAAARGERGWPPLALFRAILLAVWHDLSDVKLAEALADRVSFRRFCGFSGSEPTPERTAFVRFRAELVGRGLDRVLLDAITRQLTAKGVAVRTGTLVDATLIASASIRRDGEARWAGHRRRKPVHGYKAHVATDESGALILGVEVTTANVHYAAELATVLPVEPGDVYGDSAFGGSRAEATIAARGGRRASCRPAPGAARRRWRACSNTMPRCRGYADASRRCSAPASAVMDCGGCAGLVSPGRGCKSG